MRLPLGGLKRVGRAVALTAGFGAMGVMQLAQCIRVTLRAVTLAVTSILVAAVLASCGGGSGPGPGGPAFTGSTGGAVKVALLLPLTASGNTPAVAKALKQAAELALFDFDNPSVTLVPKDTRGTP